MQVGVECDDELAPSCAETGRERRRLAEIAAEANPPDSAIGVHQPPDFRPRAVGRAIVDEDDLQIVALLLSNGDQLRVQGREALCFVKQWNDCGKHCRRSEVGSQRSERSTSIISQFAK